MKRYWCDELTKCFCFFHGGGQRDDWSDSPGSQLAKKTKSTGQNLYLHHVNVIAESPQGHLQHSLLRQVAVSLEEDVALQGAHLVVTRELGCVHDGSDLVALQNISDHLPESEEKMEKNGEPVKPLVLRQTLQLCVFSTYSSVSGDLEDRMLAMWDSTKLLTCWFCSWGRKVASWASSVGLGSFMSTR